MDGFAKTRSALLAQVDVAARAGASEQLAFTFAQGDPPPDTPADRLAWESHILGQSITVHPLDLLEKTPAPVTPLRRLIEEGFPQNQPTNVVGVRLPGWTGGPGFFLGDQEAFLTVRGEKRLSTPEPWLPLLIHGRWSSDQWGSQWFQAETVTPIQ